MKWILVAMLPWIVASASGERSSEEIVGRLVGGSATVDGVQTPYGTTILTPSLVDTGEKPALIALSNSQIVQVGGYSSAYFERAAGGEIRVRVRAGTVSFRDSTGETSTVVPDAEVWFSQRRAGLKVGEGQDGVTAVVTSAAGKKRAEEGQKEVPVNDSSMIDPTREILLRTSLARKDPVPEWFVQEVKCRIESVVDNILNLTDPLNFSFSPGDLVVQRSEAEDQQVYTRLKSAAEAGDEILRVMDSKRVNPLEQVVVQSLDGRIREVCCVRFAREDFSEDSDTETPESVLKLASGLEHSFESGAEIVQGIRYRQEQVVTRLDRPSEAGEKVLWLEDASRVDPLQQVLVRSLDGARLEAYCVYFVRRDEEGDRVILSEALDHSYEKGTEIVQGRSSQQLAASGEVLQRMAQCCCCCDSFLLAGAAIPPDRFNPLWLLLGGAAGGGVVAGTSGGGDGGPSTPGEEPPPSRIIPPPP